MLDEAAQPFTQRLLQRAAAWANRPSSVRAAASAMCWRRQSATLRTCNRLMARKPPSIWWW
jgi:hypothetical protein